jgi:hypothetical protein
MSCKQCRGYAAVVETLVIRSHWLSPKSLPLTFYEELHMRSPLVTSNELTYSLKIRE